MRKLRTKEGEKEIHKLAKLEKRELITMIILDALRMKNERILVKEREVIDKWNT